MKIPIIVIGGPTASGKTQLAIDWALKLDGEIVSCDSRQIYKFMDIGTAKPTLEERSLIPHHLVDLIYPDETMTAGEFQKLAREIIKDIHSRGKVPFLVGGTGLYIRSVIRDIVFPPKVNEYYRKFIKDRINREGLGSVYNELCKIDPVAAGKISPNDEIRITRALEVYYATGTPISFYRKGIDVDYPEYEVIYLVLNPPRGILYRRIEERVDKMIQLGLVEETRHLLDMGYSPELSSLQTLGYREIIKYLKGMYDLESAVEEIKKETRRYAKRQSTWFRNEIRVRLITYEEAEDVFREISRYRK
ncbi:MAG: tRNA (adenosine(37)-N6)-dimethylallyltransferase MiaA [Dictyoglomi bacterium]|nr:tRNA (adenosine(37)-N6)-dimethylallyltransferase MiaA [Dictyoglomota bacterium]